MIKAEGARRLAKGELVALVEIGALITVKVTPRASRNEVTLADGVVQVRVTAVPEGGKANAAVIRLLAEALGIAPSQLVLRKGAKGRLKSFEIM